MRISQRRLLVGLLFVPLLSVAAPAQKTLRTFSVAEAKRNVASLGSSQILVHGHFWWGKEGSMIFDTGYKSILILEYSDEFLTKHSYSEMFPYGKRRKSDIVTIKGRLRSESNGKVVLIAEDVTFAEQPK